MLGPHIFSCFGCLVLSRLPLTILSQSINNVSKSSTYFLGCSTEEYYATVDLTSPSRNELEALLQSTHRRILPYTDRKGGDDVWKALIDIDPGDSSAVSALDTANLTVRLIYNQRDMAASMAGAVDGWNREHLWPRSRGIGASGADYTDLHHLVPSDWNVNAARGNKYFGACSDGDPDCRQPATSEAANDTETDSDSFLPPAEVRGDIARALMYMDLRYSGNQDNEVDLYLTDCPYDDREDRSMAYLSELLQWHNDDPVSARELIRNLQICERWQGNRNPFVDYPDMAEGFFGIPRQLPYVCNVSSENGTVENNDNDANAYDDQQEAPQHGGGGEIGQTPNRNTTTHTDNEGQGQQGGVDKDEDQPEGSGNNKGNITNEDEQGTSGGVEDGHIGGGNNDGKGEADEVPQDGEQTAGAQTGNEAGAEQNNETENNVTDGGVVLLDDNPQGSPPFNNCSADQFYAVLNDTLSPPRSQLSKLLQNTHRRRLPYPSDSEEDFDTVWKALMELYAGEPMEDPVNEGLFVDSIKLVYSQRLVPANTAGEITGWIPDQLWPKSRGIGDSGMDYSDLHHLVPSDFTTKLARGAKYFGPCPQDISEKECKRPATDEAADDTELSRNTFLPPADVRGDIARALFYMDIRYTGNFRLNEVDLQLTDCPGLNLETTMAYLSRLLEWHIEDPVSDEEVARNDQICERWQGNRNPFVDFPLFAAVFFGQPQRAPYDCGDDDNRVNFSPSTGCPGPGSIMFIGFNSYQPESFAMVSLDDIPGNIALYVTDNGWTGTDFRNNEGYLRLQVPAAGIPSGTVFGFVSGTGDGNEDTNLREWQWEKVFGTFDLSQSGDNLFLVCDDVDKGLTFISGLTSGGRWVNQGGDTTYSALPEALETPAKAYITLIRADNYRYMGNTNGSAAFLRAAIANDTNWEWSNTFRLDLEYPDFAVTYVISSDNETEARVSSGGHISLGFVVMQLAAIIVLPFIFLY